MERRDFIDILSAGKIFNNKYLDIDNETADIIIRTHFNDLDNELSLLGYSPKRLEKIGLSIKSSQNNNSIVLSDDNGEIPLSIVSSRKIDYIELFNIIKKINRYDGIIELDKLVKDIVLSEKDILTLEKEKTSGLVNFLKNENNKKTYILFSELLIDVAENFYKGTQNEE